MKRASTPEGNKKTVSKAFGSINKEPANYKLFMQSTEGSRVVIIVSFPRHVCDPLWRQGASLPRLRPAWYSEDSSCSEHPRKLYCSVSTVNQTGSSSGEFCELCESPCCCCSLGHVLLFVTPWTAARQASLSFTISWSLLKFMSIELVRVANHLILCPPPHLLLPSISSPASGSQNPGRGYLSPTF